MGSTSVVYCVTYLWTNAMWQLQLSEKNEKRVKTENNFTVLSNDYLRLLQPLPILFDRNIEHSILESRICCRVLERLEFSLREI